MRWLSKWRAAARERVRTLFFRTRAESELDEELRFHLEMEAEKLARSRGFQPDEARRRAAVAFGGVERYKEEVRHARGLAWLSGARLDFILGLRMMAKYPALTLVGGLGLAVSIAVSVGFFAFMGMHIYPVLPLEEGERIVALENRDMAINNEERRSLHDFVLWREELGSIDDLSAFRTVLRNLVPDGAPPVPVPVAEMTASAFEVARVPPLLGRYLVEDDERLGAAPVVVIGYDVWQNRFAGDPAIIGREIRFGVELHRVVGVMPKDFAFPQDHEFWAPLRADPAAFARREGPGIFIFGRLAPGVTMEQAQVELGMIGQRTSAAHPETHAKLRPMVMPYTHSLTDIQGTTTWMAIQMQLMMSLLLVVVALNVAVLIYARTAMRQGEIAVRIALGASRRRIVSQLFVEALVFSLCSAVLGLAIAEVGVRLGNAIMAEEMGAPFWANYSLRPETVLFTIAIAVVAAVIVGILPALQATGRRVQVSLRQLGGSTGIQLGKTWTVLIVAQVAIAVAALPAAVNMGWSEIRTATTRPTYPPGEFLLSEVSAEREVGAAADSLVASTPFSLRLVELIRRLDAEPEVVGATWSTSLPGRGGRIEVEGVPAPAESPTGHRVIADGVGPRYLEIYDASVLTGRGFAPGDLGPEATAVIVSEAFVKQVLGGEAALGRRIRHAAPAPTAGSESGEPSRWYEIVGVVEDLQLNRMDPELVRPVLYYPVAPEQVREASLEIRVQGTTPADFAGRLRQIALSVDPTLRLGMTYSLDQVQRQAQLAIRLVALVIGLVLLSVFLLSAAGVYALTSFTVTRRRREIGIRTALGALPGQVLRSIFARVARQVALGMVLGIGGAAVVERLTGGELLGGRAAILLPTFGVIMVVVAMLAALGPARRGLRIQPTEALRAEA